MIKHKSRASKKRNEAFAKALRTELVKMGAVPGLEPWCASLDTLQIETKAGTLFAKTYPHDSQPGAWVAARFADVERAKALLGGDGRLNPYSGKWNFDFFHEDVDLALTELRHCFARVLP